MRKFITFSILALFVFACSDDSTTTNNGSADLGSDLSLDAGSDNGVDVPDTPADMVDDTGGNPDASMDAGDDAGMDMAEDTGPDMTAMACTKEPNAGSPPATTCLHGAADWLAWQWVVDEEMTVSEIQMHTDEGSVALFADDNTRPGTTLFEGLLSDADADGWRTLTIDPPITITAGTYWLGENVGVCSTVENGTEFAYFTSNSSSGPWSGPFMAHPFTARIAGSCP